MTTVCLKAKNPLKTEAWSSVFSSVNTDAESCIFIKKLTSTCVSTILYLRKILSDDYFESKSFEGLTLKLLKSKARDNYVFKIQQWLEGAFDAIEKKYLKRLMLDIQDTESNKVLEVYTMSFNYCSEKDSLKCELSTTASNKARISVSNTKLNTLKLLQMCYAVTQTYRNLPSKVTLGMRLSYYENTPDDYQPRGYMAWELDDPEFADNARSIEIGITSTPHHFFKLFNKSCLSDRFFKNMEEQLENSSSTVTLGGADLHQKEKTSEDQRAKAREQHFHSTDTNLKSNSPVLSNPEAQSLFLVTEKNSAIPNSSKQVGKTKPLKDSISGLNSSKVRCSCLFSKQSESMFSCTSCGFLVHSECFGILEFDSSKRIRFYCHLCHRKENNNKCPDKVLVSLNNPSDQQKLSLLRRVLGHLNKSKIKTITLKRMEKLVGVDCTNNVMSVVLNKIIQIGVAKPQGKKKRCLINRNELSNKLVKYFYKVQDSVLPKPQVLPYTLRSAEALKRKTETDELFCNKKSKTIPAFPEQHANNNQTVSQQSHDIFS